MAWGKPGTGVVKSYTVEWSTMEQTTAKAAERVRDERVPEEDEEEDENPVCPLCIEELDATEIQFRPCPCGYRVCLFCYERIKLELKGICPSCRSTYGDPQMAAPPQPTASVASSGKRRGSISRNGDSKVSEQGASIAGASLGVSILGAGDHRCHSRVSPAPPILASSEFPTLSSSPPLSAAAPPSSFPPLLPLDPPQQPASQSHVASSHATQSRAAAAAAGVRRLPSDAHGAPSVETTAASWPALKAEPATAGPSVSAVSSQAQTGKSAGRDARKESGEEKGKEAGKAAEGAKAATVASGGSAATGRKQQPPQALAGAAADVAVSSSASSAAVRSSAKPSTRTLAEMLLNSPGRADLGASAAQAAAAETGVAETRVLQQNGAGESSRVAAPISEPASSGVPKPSSSVPSLQRIRDAVSPHSTDSSIPLAAAGPHGSISSPSFSTWLSPHSTSSAATLSKPVLSTANGVACNGIVVPGWASSGGSGLERLQQLHVLQRQLQQAFVGVGWSTDEMQRASEIVAAAKQSQSRFSGAAAASAAAAAAAVAPTTAPSKPVTPPPGFRPPAPPGFAPLTPPPGFGPSAGAKKADAGAGAGALVQADVQAQAAAAAAVRAGSGLGFSGQSVESVGAAWGWGASGTLAASSSASFGSPLLTPGYSSASAYTTTSAAGYTGAAGYFSGYTSAGGVSGRSGSEVGAARGTWGGGDADAAVAAIASIWGQENGLQSFSGGSMSIPMSTPLSLLGASIWSNGSMQPSQPSQHPSVSQHSGMWGSSPLARSPSPQPAAALASAALLSQGGGSGARGACAPLFPHGISSLKSLLQESRDRATDVDAALSDIKALLTNPSSKRTDTQAGAHLNQRCILAVDRGSINASLLADTSSPDYLEDNAKHLPSWLSSQLINQLYAQRHGYTFYSIEAITPMLISEGIDPNTINRPPSPSSSFPQITLINRQLACCCRWVLALVDGAYVRLEQHSVPVEHWLARLATQTHFQKADRDGVYGLAGKAGTLFHESVPFVGNAAVLLTHSGDTFKFLSLWQAKSAALGWDFTGLQAAVREFAAQIAIVPHLEMGGLHSRAIRYAFFGSNQEDAEKVLATALLAAVKFHQAWKDSNGDAV
ncbi:unnamed protein product [Closterium sp. Naga37s-1]|nr:unnamed protein product [Closterium sp. Naga37s-1]